MGAAGRHLPQLPIETPLKVKLESKPFRICSPAVHKWVSGRGLHVCCTIICGIKSHSILIFLKSLWRLCCKWYLKWKHRFHPEPLCESQQGLLPWYALITESFLAGSILPGLLRPMGLVRWEIVALFILYKYVCKLERLRQLLGERALQQNWTFEMATQTWCTSIFKNQEQESTASSARLQSFELTTDANMLTVTRLTFWC